MEQFVCPKCGSKDFEILCGIRISCKFKVDVFGNKIALGDFSEITDLDPKDIDGGSETLECSNCSEVIPIEQFKKLYPTA